MKRPKYKLSPNEVERLVKEERERLRKLRILQVREQAKTNAAVIRNQVRNEKQRLLADFTNQVKYELEAEKEEKVRKLEQKYDSTLRCIGQGHSEALHNGDGQNLAERLCKRLENEEKAAERFQCAWDQHERDKAHKEWQETENIRNRLHALEVEKERAASIAALPPPPSDDICFDDSNKTKPKKAIPMTDMKSFATTHYHIPDYQVVKAGPDEQLYDAKVKAEQTDERLKQDLKEKKRSQHEQIERARIRGNEALQKEILKHDLGDMLKDLSLLQRQDRRIRQALLAQVPTQVFVPPDQCLQDRADQQVELERRFEEMYATQPSKPDPSILQSWSEMHSGNGEDTGTANDESDEMSTLESVPLPPSEMALREVNANVKSSSDDNNNNNYSNNKKNVAVGKDGNKQHQADSVLKQLLNRIKDQRKLALSANQKPDIESARTNEKTSHPGGVSDGSHVGGRISEEWLDGDKLKMKDPVDKWVDGEKVDPDKSDGSESQSSGSRILNENFALIEELQNRIQKIEDQKMRLSQQLESQSEFYAEIQKQHRDGQEVNTSALANRHAENTVSDLGHSKGDDVSLEEISLAEERIGSQFDDRVRENGLKLRHPRISAQEDVQVMPPDNKRPIDLGLALSRLRPVAGILKGEINPQFGLLSSNGFLPPGVGGGDIHASAVSQGGVGVSHGEGHFHTGDALVGSKGQVGGAEKVGVKPNTGKEGGARRMIDFGGRDSHKIVSTSPAENLDSGDTGRFEEKATRGRVSGDDDNADDLLLPRYPGHGSSVGADLMSRKVADYHARARELQASMDEDSLSRVRHYQQNIVDTHRDRKQLLEDIRHDIERRRQALYSTARLVTGGAGAIGTAGAAGVGGGAYTQMSMSYPMLASGVNSRPSVLTGSRSEKLLEPIKPFISDQWLRSDAKKMSILKPPTAFDPEMESGKSKSKPSSSTSVDKIRKSLAFDDLNEDTSPPFGERPDNFSVTPGSLHSVGLTDESRLTSSEEDRGSPILPGSRWDTSDKSNNNSVTGSSSLNGSALVARAEERREGFERRQQELRNQLVDIQHQKEAILQRYHSGQKLLRGQQQVLHHRLATGDALEQSLSRSRSDMVRRDGDTVSSFLQPDGEKLSHSQTTFAVTSQVGSEYKLGLWALSQNRNENVSKSGTVSEADRFSLRSSGGESLNLTGDGYLEDISYHRVDTVEDGNEDEEDGGGGSVGRGTKPSKTSWGLIHQSRQKHDSRGPARHDVFSSVPTPEDRMSGYSVGGGTSEGWAGGRLHHHHHHQPTTATVKTWASVLSDGDQARTGSYESTWGHGGHASLGDSDSMSAGTGSEDSENESAAVASIQSSYARFPHQHQPHELSTIIEVDTPTTTARSRSSARLASTSTSQQSLLSVASSQSQVAPSGKGYHPLQTSLESTGIGISVDSLPDLPDVLPVDVTRQEGVSSASDPDGDGSVLATGGVSSVGNERGEAGEAVLSEMSHGGLSSYTLESESVGDDDSRLDSSGGFKPFG